MNLSDSNIHELLTGAMNHLMPHPRLLADESNFGVLREQVKSDPVSAEIFSILIQRADIMLDQPVATYEMKGYRLLDVSRAVQNLMLTLAMVARLTDEPRYTLRAIAEMRAVSAFKDWNPRHFLDTAEMTLALSVGYDWLFDQLDEQDRTMFADAIIHFGLRPSFTAPKERLGWIHGSNNWNQICHAGMVTGAIVIADREPELAREIIARAILCLPCGAAAYAPDGAYPEGPMYWTYGTTFHVILADALEHFIGDAAGTDAYPGFLSSADYMVHVTAPSNLFYCYADCRPKAGLNIPQTWFAKKTRRGDLLRGTLNMHNTDRTDEGYRHLPLALLWRDPTLKTETTPALSWAGRGSMPVALFRSAWDDPKATFVGIKGGAPNLSHAHMDIGSFVLEANGVRWAMDLGMQDYHGLEQVMDMWNQGQESMRWKVFRLGSESHNILRFDGAAQQVEGRGELMLYSESSAAAVIDMTSVYDQKTLSVQRGVRLLGNGSVLFQDEWTTGEKPVEVTWQMLTEAEQISVTNNEVHLEQNGQALILQVFSPASVNILIEDVSEPPMPYDLANPGLKRISIRCHSHANVNGCFFIQAHPRADTQGLPPACIPLAEWS